MISLRWKLLAILLVFGLVPVMVLNRFTTAYFDRFTRKVWEDHMVDAAWAVGARYREGLARPDAEAEAEALRTFLQGFAEQSRMRLEVLDADGAVICDSRDGDSEGQRYDDRPEVRRALNGRYGARAAMTPDRQYMYYYCALPVSAEDGSVRAVAYASRHTSPILHALRDLAAYQEGWMWRTALAALPISLLLAYTLTARLRRLDRAAKRVARGLPPGPLPGGRDEIGRLARSFSGMLADVGRRNQRYREFAVTLLHELKSPLSAIRGAVEILRQPPPPPEAARERFLDNIAVETARMDRMVFALRDLSRFETDSDAEREVVDQAAACERILERLRPGWTDPVAPMDFQRLGAGPFLAAWVPGRLEQVLGNLLDNAVRHTPPDGRITVTVAREGQSIVTRVADTGEGIAPANLDRVFERFFTTARHDPSGRGGLGLAVVKTIVEHHHGRIEVESTPGQGSVFRFHVPAA